MSLSKGLIFQPVKSLSEIAAKADADHAERVAKGDKFADVHASGNTYRQLYAHALHRLEKGDMLTLPEAAARLGLTSEGYRAKAAAGEAILISIEGKEAVPEWQFGYDGKIDELKLDIATAFAQGSYAYFPFEHFIAFMTKEKAEVPKDVILERELRRIFKAAGKMHYECAVKIFGTMNQLADDRKKHPEYFLSLYGHLALKLTYGGMGDQECRVPQEFQDKYLAAVQTAAATPKP